MATGYISGGIKAPLVNLGWDAPAGQMYSTIIDLLKVQYVIYIRHCVDYLHYSSQVFLIQHILKHLDPLVKFCLLL